MPADMHDMADDLGSFVSLGAGTRQLPSAVSLNISRLFLLNLICCWIELTNEHENIELLLKNYLWYCSQYHHHQYIKSIFQEFFNFRIVLTLKQDVATTFTECTHRSSL